ncbi:MAG TPA: integrase core domain-containing protein [Flavipsychrobacter sp.]|mgnify:CR=1 FL=1|jgi:transposase InsO family protein|nr:integrase core domain-containing protein [Flavipsychrobacter sp.]
MTENGDLIENAVAKRVVGIIKEEYLETYNIDKLRDTKELLKVVVDLYNNERTHMYFGNFTPNTFYHLNNNIKTERLWKNYYRKIPTIM